MAWFILEKPMKVDGNLSTIDVKWMVVEQIYGKSTEIIEITGKSIGNLWKSFANL